MQLNSQQKEAVEYLDGPLLVLAGPGTGKTQLLSQKVAYILENTDTNPDNILCLTFTDSGAQNMRERLKTLIGKASLGITIGTYHTFGSELIGFYKAYSEEFDRKLDEVIDEVRQYKIIQEIQEKLPGTDILRGDNIRDIISVISDAKGAGLNATDLETVAKQNIEDSKVLSDLISPWLEKVVPRKFKESYENAYQPIYEMLSAVHDTAPILGKIQRIIVGLKNDLEAAIQLATETEKIKPLSSWKDAYFDKDSGLKYRLNDTVQNKKLLSTAHVMAKYEDYLRENGIFDFDDMIQEAVKVLQNDAGFKATMQERFQFILLDEFQDTNPSQLAIVKELTDYEKPLIMAVGDDDQAIYEFQGAMSSNLTDFRDYYSAKVVKLTENYRSTQEILDFSRCIIKQADDRFEDKELHANKPAGKTSMIYRLEFASSDAEYGYVADKIAELVRSGVPQDEIAVISAKHKYFEPFLPYLKAKNELKIAYEKRDNLFDDARMHEIFTLARFLNQIADNKPITVPILEIFTFSWLELPVLKVVNLVSQAMRLKKSVFETMCESEELEIRAVAKWLAELSVKSFNEPLDSLLAMIVERMDVAKMGDYERFRFYDNLASLMGKLRRHYGEKPLKLADLVEMIDDYEEAGMMLGTTSPYRDAESAVQVMTAHKAKGLEFEYVFIISADHSAWGKGKGNNSLLTLPKNMTHIRHTGITDSEKLRVLYVALTRAKKSLYITNSLMDYNGKSPVRLEYLEESIEKNEQGEEYVKSPFLPTGAVIRVEEVKDYARREDNIRNWLASYIIDSPDMRSLYLERVKGLKMSASLLTAFIDIVFSGPETVFSNYVLQAPRGPDTEPLVLGNLIHATFDEVNKKQLGVEEAIEYYTKSLETYDTSPQIQNAVKPVGIDYITTTMNEFSDVILSGKSEVSFGMEKLIYNDVPLTGKIDHIVVDDDAKTIEVYDYKTSKYRAGGFKSHPTSFAYMLQLEFYKLLLGLSKEYRNYKVTKGHILYVKPDANHHQVHDKVYGFNQDDEKEFLALLRRVYQLITTLEFVDNPEMMIGPDKTRTMADVREFIKLLLA